MLHSFPFSTWFPQSRSQILTAKFFSRNHIAFSYFTRGNYTNLTSLDIVNPSYVYKSVPFTGMYNDWECSVSFWTSLEISFWRILYFSFVIWWMIAGLEAQIAFFKLNLLLGQFEIEKHSSFLGYDSASLGKLLSTFLRSLLPPFACQRSPRVGPWKWGEYLLQNVGVYRSTQRQSEKTWIFSNAAVHAKPRMLT